MGPDPDVLHDDPSYLSHSDPEDETGSEAQSFDEYDMFGLDDNPDEIVFARPDSRDASIAPPNLDPDGDAQPSVGGVYSLNWDSNDKNGTSLDDVIKTCPDDSEAKVVRHSSLYTAF